MPKSGAKLSRTGFTDLMTLPPEFLRPRTRLFLSIDIDGSTTQKQLEDHALKEATQDRKLDTLADLTSNWMKSLTVFYREFERRFVQAWHNRSEDDELTAAFKDSDTLSSMGAFRPELFKLLGDELIYSVEFEEVDQLLVTLCIWQNAVSNFITSELANGIEVKSAAWIAGFPISNHEFVTLREPMGQTFETVTSRDAVFAHWYSLALYYGDVRSAGAGLRNRFNRDFVGPSMDAGFRIKSLSSGKKMAITPELAYLMSANLDHGGMKLQEERLGLYYDGKRQLPGLTADGYYPFFWLNTDGNPKFEDEECFGDNFRKGPIPKLAIREYCIQFFGESGSTIPPYLSRSERKDVSVEPNGFKLRIDNLARSWQRELDSFIAGDKLPQSTDGQHPGGLDDFKKELY